jgi:hypothetical protein
MRFGSRGPYGGQGTEFRARCGTPSILTLSYMMLAG